MLGRYSGWVPRNQPRISNEKRLLRAFSTFVAINPYPTHTSCVAPRARDSPSLIPISCHPDLLNPARRRIRSNASRSHRIHETPLFHPARVAEPVAAGMECRILSASLPVAPYMSPKASRPRESRLVFVAKIEEVGTRMGGRTQRQVNESQIPSSGRP